MAHQPNVGYAMSYYQNHKNNLRIYNRLKNNNSNADVID